MIFTINNFLDLNKPIESKRLMILSNEWYLEVDPNHSEDDVKYLSVYLMLKKSQKSSVRSDFCVFIINDKDEEKHKIVSGVKDFAKPNSDNGCGYRHFITKDELLTNRKELLPQNKLTLCFDSKAFDEIDSINYKNFNFENCFTTNN